MLNHSFRRVERGHGHNHNQSLYCTLTLHVSLAVHESHAGELLQLAGEPFLRWLGRVTCSHPTEHLLHELREQLRVGRGGGRWGGCNAGSGGGGVTAGGGGGGSLGGLGRRDWRNQAGRHAGQPHSLIHIRGTRPESLHPLLDLHDSLQGEVSTAVLQQAAVLPAARLGYSSAAALPAAASVVASTTRDEIEFCP